MVDVDVNEKNGGSSLKFLCSYNGRILPCSTDGKLRYVGGHTRVLSVDRSITFQELMKKLCEFSVDLRCQLPNGDLKTLISVKSDEDLANIVEEYDDRVSRAKIRAVYRLQNRIDRNHRHHQAVIDLRNLHSRLLRSLSLISLSARTLAN